MALHEIRVLYATGFVDQQGLYRDCLVYTLIVIGCSALLRVRGREAHEVRNCAQMRWISRGVSMKMDLSTVHRRSITLDE